MTEEQNGVSDPVYRRKIPDGDAPSAVAAVGDRGPDGARNGVSDPVYSQNKSHNGDVLSAVAAVGDRGPGGARNGVSDPVYRRKILDGDASSAVAAVDDRGQDIMGSTPGLNEGASLSQSFRMKDGSHRHLQRLERVWIDSPIWFVTTCTARRRAILDSPLATTILIQEWRASSPRHGWQVGNYVVMPDHVHFFCAPNADPKTLSAFIGLWKQWTSKRILGTLGLQAPLWQSEFFEHLLRSEESYAQKWDYVRENPVRAGLVGSANEWPYWGEIEPL